MNKFVKGSIAAAAATVLLLGGAGSLAYWNASAGLDDATTISAGSLTLSVEDGDWSGGELDVWVPGDTKTFTADLVLVAEGDNIQGEIDFDAASLTADGQPLDGEIADQFVFSFDKVKAALAAPGVVSYSEATDELTFDGPGRYTIPVEVEVEFIFEDGEQNDSQLATLKLSDITFTATQTAP